MKFLDAKNDVAFRKIFGNENKKEILISFLNAVLELEGERKIVSVDILSPHQLPEFQNGKSTILDLKATDQRKNVYLIEMQVAKLGDLNKRVLYYASQCYTSQIEKGETYENLRPIFFIGILDFNVTKNDDYLSRHQVLDVKTGEQFIKDIEFNFIELPKFKKSAEELTSVIEQWVYFFKHAKELELIPEGVTDPGLKSAYRGAEEHNWNKEELEAYWKMAMKMHDEEGIVRLAVEEAVEKAVARKEEEKVKALAEKEEEKIMALAQKEKEKEEEKITALAQKEKEMREETALKLLDLGASMENISKVTGLTIEQIEELKTRRGINH